MRAAAAIMEGVAIALSSGVTINPSSLDYRALNARWLGLPVLSHWDRNAPLPYKPDRTIGWGDARETVLKAYGGFAPEMAGIAKRFFDKSWIDAPVRLGKAPGAFSAATVPSVPTANAPVRAASTPPIPPSPSTATGAGVTRARGRPRG